MKLRQTNHTSTRKIIFALLFFNCTNAQSNQTDPIQDSFTGGPWKISFSGSSATMNSSGHCWQPGDLVFEQVARTGACTYDAVRKSCSGSSPSRADPTVLTVSATHLNENGPHGNWSWTRDTPLSSDPCSIQCPEGSNEVNGLCVSIDEPDTPEIGQNEPDDGDDGENSCPTDFSNSPTTNNPVQLATGAKQESTHCLTLPYKNAGIKLGLQYDSSWIGYTETRANDIAGPGWTVGHTQRIDVSKLNDAEPQLDYVHSNGLTYPMVPKTGGGSGSAGNITLWLMQDLDDNSANTETSQDTTTQEYTFTQANGNYQTFDANGELVKSCFASDDTCINYSTSSVSENGTNYEMRSLSLVDNSTSAETQRMEMLIRVSDNKLKIVRDASSQIPAAERREVTFSYNAQGQLSQIVQADGATTSYEYDSEGYLTKKVEPNMQDGSGTEAEGWSIEIDYETTAREVYPKRRVTKETWKDAANNAVRSVVFNWDATGVTIETYDESTTSPTLLTSERNEFDSEGRLTKAYLTDSTTLFTQFEYCDPSTDAVNCPSIQTEALYRRVTAPNGIVTDYSYDAKGNMISNTISDSL
jgi:YD repeat-containing protein